MDSLIKRFHSVPDDDLMLCDARGVAWQRDMSKGRQQYDAKYLEKFDAYDSKIEARVNYERCGFVQKQMIEAGIQHPTANPTVLDVGAGSLHFMRDLRSYGFDVSGFEVIQEMQAVLKDMDAYASDARAFDAVTMWDTIEHLENPAEWLTQIKKGALLFVSLPIFLGLGNIRDSKHYRPGEHLYYFRRQGFIDWIAEYGFRLVAESDHENEAGREDIGAFAFVRDLPTYQDFIDLYDKMHAERFYGSSAVELHLHTVANVVRKLNPKSILDYGCGRSDLIAHFWLDGKRTIARYDPAIRKHRALPRGRFDLVLCCDVMEHIPMAHIDKVLTQIKERSTRCLFTISTKLARAKLPDGSNAHCTILTKWEWIKWLRTYFAYVHTLPSEWEHELILMATEDKTL